MRKQLKSDDVRASIVRRPRRNGRSQKSNSQRSVEQYAGDAYSLALRTMKGLNAVRKLINIETKVLDSDTSITTATTTPVVTYLSGIAQGTDLTNRVGDSIKIQHISILGRFAIVPAETTFTIVRYLFFRDNENQGSAPAASDILETVSGTTTVRSPLNYINRKRFSVLVDEYLVLNQTSDLAVPVRYDIPFNKHVNYRGTSSAIGSAGEGAFFSLLVTDEATNAPTCNLYYQFTFTDD